MSDYDDTLIDERPQASLHTRSQGVIEKLRAGLAQLRLANPLGEIGLSGNAPESLLVVPSDPWPGDTAVGTELVQGILRFGGQVIQLEQMNWAPTGATPGFMESLHRFDWLRDLRALGGDVARRQARMMVRSWIEQHAAWSAQAWDPGLLGPRLSNWLGLYDFFCATADDEFRALVVDSLRRQARQLGRSLSSIPQGHHRIAALKGLFYAGICLPKGETRLALALRLLSPELSSQVLGDGGHVERNPQVALEVLRDLIDIRTLLRTGAQEVPEKLQHAIDRLAPAIRFFRHADGALAQFNGGREATPALIEAVLAQADARGRPLKSMTHSGFERIISGRTCIIMDCGAPPPPAFAAQAFAGLLAFEMSVGRDRMIVNCGSHPARMPVWRRALGATAAHSTLTLNDTNAAELAERGFGRCPQTVTCERQEESGAAWVEASHDGYEVPFRTLHFRRLYVGDSGDDVRGEDTLEGPAGLDFAIRFHLHPSVQASLIQQGQAVLLALPSGGGWRLRTQGGTLALEESLYCGRNEEPRRSLQIVINGISQAEQTIIKWALQREKRV